MASQRKKLKLSKNLLEMKFMKRTKEKTIQETEDQEQRERFANEITPAMMIHGSRFVSDSSYVPFEELRFGRMSFKGANTEIEKLMRKIEQKKNPPAAEDTEDLKEVDVSAKEVAQALNRNYNKTNKFNGRSRGFKRPHDD